MRDGINSQSPQDMGSYLAGLVSDVQDGTTPSTQLKFRPVLLARSSTHAAGIYIPKKNGIDTLSMVDRL